MAPTQLRCVRRLGQHVFDFGDAFGRDGVEPRLAQPILTSHRRQFVFSDRDIDYQPVFVYQQGNV